MTIRWACRMEVRVELSLSFYSRVREFLCSLSIELDLNLLLLFSTGYCYHRGFAHGMLLQLLLSTSEPDH
jgi:hypothetical protein